MKKKQAKPPSKVVMDDVRFLLDWDALVIDVEDDTLRGALEDLLGKPVRVTFEPAGQIEETTARASVEV